MLQPSSNRCWVSFQTICKLETNKSITYNVLVRTLLVRHEADLSWDEHVHLARGQVQHTSVNLLPGHEDTAGESAAVLPRSLHRCGIWIRLRIRDGLLQQAALYAGLTVVRDDGLDLEPVVCPGGGGS